jgi:hypothetical protein
VEAPSHPGLTVVCEEEKEEEEEEGTLTAISACLLLQAWKSPTLLPPNLEESLARLVAARAQPKEDRAISVRPKASCSSSSTTPKVPAQVEAFSHPHLEERRMMV